MDEKNQDSKQRILDAALDVFFEVGFEGARVSDIARRARVNQALIYYYFSSKEELLTELININMKEMLHIKDRVMGDVDIFNETDYQEATDTLMDFLHSKKKILSILFGEIIKNDNDEKTNKGFELITPVIEDSKKRLRAFQVEEKEIDKGIIAAFFFGMMPCITYIILGEKWADYYGFDKNHVSRVFSEYFKEHYIESAIRYIKHK